jgi:hypothetical protein
LKDEEKQRLLDLLPRMVQYINKNKHMSILSRVYGIYEVKLPGVDPVNLILQRNCMQVQGFNKMLRVFDLKGSTFGREAMIGRRKAVTLKDIDFLKLYWAKEVDVNLSDVNRKELLEIIELDV